MFRSLFRRINNRSIQQHKKKNLIIGAALTVSAITITTTTTALAASKNDTTSQPIITVSALNIRLDEFASRQFSDTFPGTKLSSVSKYQFMVQVKDAIEKEKQLILVNGYAPFCKHIFINNFIPDLKVTSMPINDSNLHFLQSDYLQRTDKELPVLVRWFPSDKVDPPTARYLDLILYSKQQINKERLAMGEPEHTENYDWGIISVKAQMEDFETPMDPITMMRNALGTSEGGSGIPLERSKYIQSVSYWKYNASVK